MGERIIGSGETENGSSGKNARSTGTTGTGNGRTGGRRTGGTKGEQSQKVPELAHVKTPKVVNVDVPGAGEEKKEEKKRRGRPAGSTKKKTTNTKKQTVDDGQVSLLLMTVFGVIASKKGLEEFALSLDEAKQIATPLASILSKNEGVAAAAGEYADHIALAFAAFTIMLPKFLAFKQKKESEGEQSNGSNINKERQVGTNDQHHDRENRITANDQNVSTGFNGELNRILSPIN